MHQRGGNSSGGAMDNTPLLSERMRKRRAFADRELDAVMYQREQAAAAEIQRMATVAAILNPVVHLTHNSSAVVDPGKQLVLANFNSFLQQFVKPIQQVTPHDVVDVDDADDSSDNVHSEDEEIDVTSDPTPDTANVLGAKCDFAKTKGKITFSVESIIGKAWNNI